MGCAICDSSKEKVYRGVQDKLTEQALVSWMIISLEEISIEEIRKSISAWKKTLRLVVEEDRGHIEPRLEINKFYSDVAFFETLFRI